MGDIFLFVILFVYGFAVILIGCVALKNKKPKNKVHFYVARDKNGSLALYLGKPFRGHTTFYSDSLNRVFCLAYNIDYFGLKYEDFDSLKWEDEPVEVFLNTKE